MHLQNEHHFEGLYVGHFWSEFDKTWTGWSLRSQGFQESKILEYTVCTWKMVTTLEAYISAIFSQNSIKLGQGGP